jgi:hypothetical protein
MFNINPRRGLTNGTPVTFHSLVLDPREDRERLVAAITEGNNDVVILQYNPTQVLVKITHADPDDFIGLTAVEGDVITNTHQQTIRYHRPGDEDALKIAKYILRLYRKIANYILTLLRVETAEKMRYRDQPCDVTSCYQNLQKFGLTVF